MGPFFTGGVSVGMYFHNYFQVFVKNPLAHGLIIYQAFNPANIILSIIILN